MKKVITLLIQLTLINLCLSSQESMPIIGDWYVEWHDYPSAGVITRAAISVTEQDGGLSASGVMGPDFSIYRPYRNQNISASVTGKVWIHHGYDIMGDWGGRGELEMITPDYFEGVWSYSGTNGGKEIWRRNKPEMTDFSVITDKIQTLTAQNPYKEITMYYSNYDWGPDNNMPGNRPSLKIEIRGNNIWGINTMTLFEGKGMEIRHIGWLYDNGVIDIPGSKIGIKYEIVLWPDFRPGIYTFMFNHQPIILKIDVENFPAAILPKGDEIPHKGMLSDADLEKKPTREIKPEEIQLAKIIHRRYLRTEGYGLIEYPIIYYDSFTHYEINNSWNPPETGRPLIPGLKYQDQILLYFTYPEELAYLVQEGKNHPARVVVEIKYPHTRSSSGYFTHTWQLYSVRGFAEMKSSTSNFINLTVSQEDHEIANGDLTIRWSLNGMLVDEKTFPLGIPQ